MVEHWRVQVDINGEMVLAIESALLAGQDITEERAAVIRDCARHLLSFVDCTADDKELLAITQQPQAGSDVSPKLPSFENIWEMLIDLSSSHTYALYEAGARDFYDCFIKKLGNLTKR